MVERNYLYNKKLNMTYGRILHTKPNRLLKVLEATFAQ